MELVELADRLKDNVIATRELHLNGSENVSILIGAPVAINEDRDEFWCCYQIIGIGNEKIKRGIGIDEVQSLCLALQGISTDLYFSDEYQAGKLSWEGGMTFSDLGFPVSDGMLESVNEAKSRVETLRQS